MLAALQRRPWLTAGGSVVLVAALIAGVRALQKPPAPKPVPAVVQPRIESVSALGHLEPAGDVRRLAAPVGAMGGSPRLSSLLVKEGERVRRGQLLADFDNRPGLLSDLAAVNARVNSLRVQIGMQQREVERYQSAANSGAAAMVLLEEKRDELVVLQGKLQEALAERKGLQVDLNQSQLRAPLDGLVLKIHSRVGERPGNDGVLELGAGDQMEAVAEVYESDINRVRLGQTVTLVSENGGFSGSLQARVIRIAPQVRQRAVLSTDPTGDADARVVEVRLALSPADARRVSNLSGLKIIARFQP
jgi:HlyD family secretion protein